MLHLLYKRGTIETQDGALIYIAYIGVLDLGEDGSILYAQNGRPVEIGTDRTC